MQKYMKALLASAVLALGLTAPVHAQQSAQAIQPNAAQLDTYVKAAQKVSGVAEQYQVQFDAATDDDSRQNILNEANVKMVEAVEQSGMTLEEYNGISISIQEDPQLRQQVESRVGGGQ